MARQTKPLTNTEITQAKPKDKEYNLSDGEGLMLRIRVNGSKSWLFNYYRPFNKKRANIVIGQYPTVTLAQARETRREYRALLANDIDPKDHKTENAQKQLRAQLHSLEFVAKQWFEVKKTKVNPNFAFDIWRSLELHIFPDLGKMAIDKITAQDAITTIKKLEEQGKLETVKRVCQRLNEIMIFAVNTGIALYNPLAGIKVAFEKPKPKNFPTLKPEELPRFMQSLNNTKINLVTRYLVQWQLHTMVRPNESAGARWEEIDFDNKLWIIPAERMKKGKALTVPLSPQALAILENIKPISQNSPFIFPADRSPKKQINQQAANAALVTMGFKDELVAHGLRALASTTLNEQGFDADIIETALAHKDKNQVRRAYNRAEYLERRRVMMCWWSQHIENAANGDMNLVNSVKGLRIVNE